MPEVERPVPQIQSKKRLLRAQEDEHDAYIERLTRVASQVKQDSSDPEDSPRRAAME
jgi:hypothetical protein